VGEVYTRLLTAVGGLDPYAWTVTGALPQGLGYTEEGAISGTPVAAGTFPLRLGAIDAKLQSASQSCNLVVQPQAPKIGTACPLPAATLGADYSATLQASNGAAPYSWTVRGALPAGLTLSRDGKIAGRPQSLGAFEFAVQVSDARAQSDGRDCSLAVALPQLPEVRLAGMGATLEPASPASITVQLGKPYSLAIQGVVSLAATPDTAGMETGTNRADPRMRFARGQTSIRFTIPAGAQSATLPLMSTGTVAGTAEFRITELRAGGVNVSPLPPPMTARIPRRAPVLTDACFTTSGTGIELNLTGYSTPREVTRAGVQLAVSGGSALQPASMTFDVSGVAGEWFASDDSVRFGSAFTLKLPVAIQGGGGGVASASVTLSNSTGTSAAKTAQKCQ
jgi:hypothetical protein